MLDADGNITGDEEINLWVILQPNEKHGVSKLAS